VSLWDRIIEAKEDARFTLPFVRSKYKLLDQARGASAGARAAAPGMPRCFAERCALLNSASLLQGQHLRGLSANLTLYWNVMPIVGRLSTGHHTFPPVTLPAECAARRSTARGAHCRN
jgi:hypothetical protein